MVREQEKLCYIHYILWHTSVEYYSQKSYCEFTKKIRHEPKLNSILENKNSGIYFQYPVKNEILLSMTSFNVFCGQIYIKWAVISFLFRKVKPSQEISTNKFIGSRVFEKIDRQRQCDKVEKIVQYRPSKLNPNQMLFVTHSYTSHSVE